MKLTVAFHNSVNIPKTGAAGHRARGWLRISAAKRKFAGLTTDGVTGIFNWFKSSGLTMAPGSTRSLKGMSAMSTCDYRCNFTCLCLYTSHSTKVYLQYWEKCVKKIEFTTSSKLSLFLALFYKKKLLFSAGNIISCCGQHVASQLWVEQVCPKSSYSSLTFSVRHLIQSSYPRYREYLDSP